MARGTIRRNAWRAVGIAGLAAMLAAGGCAARRSTDAGIEAVRAFNAARDRGDMAAARAMLTPDARVWYENPTGPGSPWRPGEGPWAAWDEHFRGSKRIIGDYQRDGDAVWAIVDETNDYYRLTERTWSRTLLAWFVTDEHKIRGFFVAGVGESSSRAEEFEAWARANHPAEFEHLYPGGRLDPSGDRPVRMRALLMKWRASVGLPAID